MQIRKIVRVEKPVDVVFAYLADFTTTTEWDPGTVQTVRTKGDGLIGTEYLNTSIFAGRKSQLTYVVEEFTLNKSIRLRGENKSVIAHDTMTFRRVATGTEVTYTAELTFKGLVRLVSVFLKPAFARLGTEAEVGMAKALRQL